MNQLITLKTKNYDCRDQFSAFEPEIRIVGINL